MKIGIPNEGDIVISPNFICSHIESEDGGEWAAIYSHGTIVGVAIPIITPLASEWLKGVRQSVREFNGGIGVFFINETSEPYSDNLWPFLPILLWDCPKCGKFIEFVGLSLDSDSSDYVVMELK